VGRRPQRHIVQQVLIVLPLADFFPRSPVPKVVGAVFKTDPLSWCFSYPLRCVSFLTLTKRNLN
jgi:hypothetical protein